MTSKPTWTSTISFGNIITVVSMLVLGAGMFFAVQNMAQQNAEDIQDLERARLVAETRLTALEIAKAADDQKFANILQLLDRIDARLERIERGGLNRQ